jgi:hypothetical protein
MSHLCRRQDRDRVEELQLQKKAQLDELAAQQAECVSGRSSAM